MLSVLQVNDYIIEIHIKSSRLSLQLKRSAYLVICDQLNLHNPQRVSTPDDALIKEPTQRLCERCELP